MPILGILASAQIGANSGAYDSIATQTVTSGSTTSVTFNSIPQTYKHLQMRFSANISQVAGANFQFNGDTGANYVTHYLVGSGSGSGTSTNSLAQNYAYGSVYGQGYDGGSYIYTGGVIDILDYTNTSKNKTLRSFIGVDRNGTGAIQLISSLWLNTSAVTSIKFLTELSVNFAIGTTISLYGIKG